MKRSPIPTLWRPAPSLKGARHLVTNLKGWLEKRGEEHQRLYAKYGKALEPEHTGEYVAIGTNGETILGTRMGEVAQQALDTLGKGNFGVFRVGYPTLTRWLKITS